jgi:hypothetical protein
VDDAEVHVLAFGETESEQHVQSLTWQKFQRAHALRPVVPVMFPFAAPGLLQFLREASQALPQFNNEMRKAAEQVAQHVVDRAVVSATLQGNQGMVLLALKVIGSVSGCCGSRCFACSTRPYPHHQVGFEERLRFSFSP